MIRGDPVIDAAVVPSVTVGVNILGKAAITCYLGDHRLKQSVLSTGVLVVDGIKLRVLFMGLYPCR